MPVENFSGTSDQNCFSIGFVEDLIADLSPFLSLQFLSSYATRKMAKDSNDQLVVARQLGIDNLLMGNMRRLKGHIRISNQLMETTGGCLYGRKATMSLRNDV